MKLPIYIQHGRELIALKTLANVGLDQIIRVYDQTPNEHHYYQGKVTKLDDSEGSLFLKLRVTQDHSTNRPSWRGRSKEIKFDHPFNSDSCSNVIIIIDGDALTPNEHHYYGRHNLTSQYDPDFEYMTIDQYPSVQEWLDHIFILENDNENFKTSFGNQVSFIDKRSGIKYSTMQITLSHELLDDIKTNYIAAERLLIHYYFLHNAPKLNLIPES